MVSKRWQVNEVELTMNTFSAAASDFTGDNISDTRTKHDVPE